MKVSAQQGFFVLPGTVESARLPGRPETFWVAAFVGPDRRAPL